VPPVPTPCAPHWIRPCIHNSNVPSLGLEQQHEQLQHPYRPVGIANNLLLSIKYNYITLQFTRLTTFYQLIQHYTSLIVLMVSMLVQPANFCIVTPG